MKDNLPAIFQGFLPTQTFEFDPVKKLFQNITLRQQAKSEKRKAEIAEYLNTQSKNFYEMRLRDLMFEKVLKAREEALEDLQRRREYNLQISAQQVKKLVLENHILTTEAKSGDLDFKLKLKELGMEETDA